MTVELEVSPAGKVLVLGMLGMALSFVGVIFDLPSLLVAGMIVGGSAALTLWVLRPGCRGEVQWKSTEDGEIQVGTCQSCDRWLIRIRDSIVAHGRGYGDFRDAVEQLAERQQAHLPHLAARLRKLLDKLEGERKPEDGFELERDYSNAP